MTNINYRERKQAGTVILARHNDAHVLILRQFSPDTGRELAPEQLGVSVKMFEDRRADLLEQIAQLDEIIADLKGTSRTLGEMLAEIGNGRSE